MDIRIEAWFAANAEFVAEQARKAASTMPDCEVKNLVWYPTLHDKTASDIWHGTFEAIRAKAYESFGRDHKLVHGDRSELSMRYREEILKHWSARHGRST